MKEGIREEERRKEAAKEEGRKQTGRRRKRRDVGLADISSGHFLSLTRHTVENRKKKKAQASPDNGT